MNGDPRQSGVHDSDSVVRTHFPASVDAGQDEPIFCRPEAFQYFLQQMPVLWSTSGLIRAAIAVSMHALDDVRPQQTLNAIHGLSQRVKAAAASPRPCDLHAALHRVLFEEDGYAGDSDKYYHALNSYLPAVINSRRGLPITLGLLYKAVGEGAGLTIAGVNAPGHFLVRVRLERGWQIVDPFYRGEFLSREQVFDRLDRIAQRLLPRSDELLAAPTHLQWLYRVIGNLRQLFTSEDRRDDLAAMNELLAALRQSQS
jgi:regulator of sirC expression with transglutaminase-like and TPR domain